MANDPPDPTARISHGTDAAYITRHRRPRRRIRFFSYALKQRNMGKHQ